MGRKEEGRGEGVGRKEGRDKTGGDKNKRREEEEGGRRKREGGGRGREDKEGGHCKKSASPMCLSGHVTDLVSLLGECFDCVWVQE